MGEIPGATSKVDAALAETQQATEDARIAFDSAADALHGIGDSAMSLGEAKDEAISAINAMNDAAAIEGATLDGTNDASVRLRDSVRDVEKAHKDAAVSIIENGGTLAEAQVEYDKSRVAIMDMLIAKGMDATQAAIWADAQLGSATEVKGGIDALYQAWLNMPENKETEYRVEAEEAVAKLADLKARLESIRPNYYTRVTLETLNIGGRTIDSGAQAPATSSTRGRRSPRSRLAPCCRGSTARSMAACTGSQRPAGRRRTSPRTPAFRDHSLNVWEGVGRRIGAFQPAPASRAFAGGAAMKSAAAPQYSFGDICGIDPELIVGEINTQVRRAVAVSGLYEGVGD